MSVLDYAIRIIKATMKNHSNESFFPYFFIVGAGISVPEIPAAYEIIDECKDIYVKCHDKDCIALLWYFAYIEKTIHSEVIVWNCF